MIFADAIAGKAFAEATALDPNLIHLQCERAYLLTKWGWVLPDPAVDAAAYAERLDKLNRSDCAPDADGDVHWKPISTEEEATAAWLWAKVRARFPETIVASWLPKAQHSQANRAIERLAAAADTYIAARHFERRGVYKAAYAAPSEIKAYLVATAKTVEELADRIAALRDMAMRPGQADTPHGKATRAIYEQLVRGLVAALLPMPTNAAAERREREILLEASRLIRTEGDAYAGFESDPAGELRRLSAALHRRAGGSAAELPHAVREPPTARRHLLRSLESIWIDLTGSPHGFPITRRGPFHRFCLSCLGFMAGTLARDLRLERVTDPRLDPEGKKRKELVDALAAAGLDRAISASTLERDLDRR